MYVKICSSGIIFLSPAKQSMMNDNGDDKENPVRDGDTIGIAIGVLIAPVAVVALVVGISLCCNREKLHKRCTCRLYLFHISNYLVLTYIRLLEQSLVPTVFPILLGGWVYTYNHMLVIVQRCTLLPRT